MKENFRYKDFYEEDALRHNIWEVDRSSYLYFKEILRYTKCLELINGERGSVLDLGCGDGYLSYLLVKENFDVVGLDISYNRLEKFRDKARQYGISQIIGDAHSLPFADESFDIVIASEVIEHLPNLEVALDESYRVLKKDGLIIISVPYKEKIDYYICPYCLNKFHPYGHLHSFDENILITILEGHNFNPDKIVLFRNWRTEGIRERFGLPFSHILVSLDNILSKLFPNLASYIAIRGCKVIK